MRYNFDRMQHSLLLLIIEIFPQINKFVKIILTVLKALKTALPSYFCQDFIFCYGVVSRKKHNCELSLV